MVQRKETRLPRRVGGLGGPPRPTRHGHAHPAAAALKGTRHDHKIARTKGVTKGAIRKPPRASYISLRVSLKFGRFWLRGPLGF